MPQYEQQRLKRGKRETSVQGRNDKKGFKVCKTKGARNKRKPMQSLNISNKFKILSEDEEILVQTNDDLDAPNDSEAEMKNLDMKLRDCKSKKKYKKFEKNKRSQNKIDSEKKKKKYCISKHKTDNPFHLLEDIDDEDIEEIIRKVKLIKTPKKKLKKCRFCNQKRRSCQIDPTKCPARNQNCFTCNKIGHFRKSLCCKKNRRKNLKKIARNEEEQSPSSSISKKSQKLILQTIKKIEILQLLENSLLQNKKINEEQMKQEHMKNTDENSGKEEIGAVISSSSSLKKRILKAANNCAKKFATYNFEEIRPYMISYCNRKLDGELSKNLDKAENM